MERVYICVGIWYAIIDMNSPFKEKTGEFKLQICVGSTVMLNIAIAQTVVDAPRFGHS